VFFYLQRKETQPQKKEGAMGSIAKQQKGKKKGGKRDPLKTEKEEKENYT